jgi:hypothetical protein
MSRHTHKPLRAKNRVIEGASGRNSGQHLSRVTEPRFDKATCKRLPVLRGFKEKLRQGKSPIKPEAFEVTEAKRETRHARRKAKRDKARAIGIATRRPKRKQVAWWR